MADNGNISVRISLAGAEEMIAKLNELGKDGQAAIEKIKVAVDKANAPVTKFGVGVSEASKTATKGFDTIADAGQRLGTALGPLGGNITNVTSLLRGGLLAAIVAVVGATVYLAKTTADRIVQEADYAEALGLTVKEYRGLVDWARAAGVAQDEFNAALQRFAGKAAGEGQKQLAAYTELAKQFGSTSKVAFGIRSVPGAEEFKVTDEALTRVAQRFKAMWTAARDPAGLQSIEQIKTKLLQVASGADETAVKTRELITGTGANIDLLLSPAERLDKALKAASGDFGAMGAEMLDLDGKIKGTRDALVTFIDTIASMDDGVEKARRVAEAFGRSVGPELVSAINEGSDALQKFIDKAKDLDESVLRRAEATKKAFQDIARAADQAQLAVGTALLLPEVKEGDGRRAAGTFREFRERLKAETDAMVRESGQAGTEIAKEIAAGVTDEGAGPFQGLIDSFQRAYDAIKKHILEHPLIRPNADGGGDVGAGGDGATDFSSARRRSDAGAQDARQADTTRALAQENAALGAAILAVKAAIVEYNNCISLMAANTITQRENTDVFIASLANLQTSLNVASTALALAIPGSTGAGLSQGILSAVDAAMQLSQAFTGVGPSIDDISAKVAQLAAAAVAALNQIAAAASMALAATSAAASGAGQSAPSFAGGGYIRGPGTATSDSIPAWLSDGEFVQRAKAVRYYGPNFMAALNALRIPRDMFKGYAAGGLVEGLNRQLSGLAMPRFADGGMAGAGAERSAGGRHLGTLSLVGDNGQRFEMMTDEATAAQLQRYAVRRARRASAPKPSWSK